MNYITAFPSLDRFLWEAKTYIYSLEKLNVPKDNIFIITTNDNMNVVNKIVDLGVHVFSYDDNRHDKSYIPSLKPFLFWSFLKDNPLMQDETFFYHDSDVVFLKEFTSYITEPELGYVYGSDCNGYMNLDYMKTCTNSDKVIDTIIKIVGLSYTDLDILNDSSIGAQYVIPQPTIELFEKIYYDSNKIYHAVDKIDTNFQKWVAEMYATLWNFVYFGYSPLVSNELDFAWSTDEKYNNQKILHNAGVVDDKELFFKGKYLSQPKIDDLNQSTGKVSDIYVSFLKKALYGE